MKALIIYDQSALASKVKAMLERAADRTGDALLWTVRPWRLEMLIRPLALNRALKDAAEAHLIVFAVRGQADLSPRLLEWLEMWAGRRQVQDAALAVFDGGHGDSLSATVAPELSQFAARHGLSFISSKVDPSEEESALLAQSRTNARQLTPRYTGASTIETWGVESRTLPELTGNRQVGWGQQGADPGGNQGRQN